MPEIRLISLVYPVVPRGVQFLMACIPERGSPPPPSFPSCHSPSTHWLLCIRATFWSIWGCNAEGGVEYLQDPTTWLSVIGFLPFAVIAAHRWWAGVNMQLVGSSTREHGSLPLTELQTIRPMLGLHYQLTGSSFPRSSHQTKVFHIAFHQGANWRLRPVLSGWSACALTMNFGFFHNICLWKRGLKCQLASWKFHHLGPSIASAFIYSVDHNF